MLSKQGNPLQAIPPNTVPALRPLKLAYARLRGRDPAGEMFPVVVARLPRVRTCVWRRATCDHLTPAEYSAIAKLDPGHKWPDRLLRCAFGTLATRKGRIGKGTHHRSAPAVGRRRGPSEPDKPIGESGDPAGEKTDRTSAPARGQHPPRIGYTQAGTGELDLFLTFAVMSTIRRVPVQYVFVDVIGFTRPDRTVEDMLSIIESLNGIVWSVLEEHSIGKGDLILLPTGDGMCIGLLNQAAEDTHLQMAESIRDFVIEHNRNVRGSHSTFDLHLAVHEGKDILITDINGNRNIIGAGINRASRLMAFGTAREIIISEVVYEGICRDAKYKDRYKQRNGQIKEGESVCYYSNVKEEPRDLSWAVNKFVEALNYTFGPPLTLSDIDQLSINDKILHRVYGLGTIRNIGPSLRGNGRQVVIDFPNRQHSVRLTNQRGNYFKVIPKVS